MTDTRVSPRMAYLGSQLRGGWAATLRAGSPGNPGRPKTLKDRRGLGEDGNSRKVRSHQDAHLSEGWQDLCHLQGAAPSQSPGTEENLVPRTQAGSAGIKKRNSKYYDHFQALSNRGTA
jgi:hypothetical protein